jgi:Uncharacterized conserved protein
MCEDYHDSNLTKETRNLEMARQSLIEEFQAINWYQERFELTGDEELKKILAHNRDEEKEHAAMLMEYIRSMTPFRTTNFFITTNRLS